MMTVFSFFILTGAFILRALPRIKWKNFNGTDSQFHCYYIDLIRSNGHVLPERENRVLGGSNECTYPYFYHWLLSFFSKSFVEFWDRFSGFVFDALNGLLVLLLLSTVREFNLYESCLIMAAYMIAPGLTFSFIGPRPYSLTPRNFAQLVFTAACAFLILMVPGLTGFNLALLGGAAFLFSILLI